MSINTLFISTNDVKERTGISKSIDDKEIKPCIKLAQDIFLQPALGSTLYSRIQTGVNGSSLNASETTLLQNYIADCLVWATMAQMVTMTSYSFYAKGVLQKTSEQSQVPSKNELDSITQQYESIAEFYKQRLINYLRANYTLFSQYSDPGCGWDVIQPVVNAYESPIYLGDLGCRTIASTPPATNYEGTARYTATGGETSFVVEALDGKHIISAARSGLVKDMTETATTDTDYLIRTGTSTTITLPTGDMAQAGEKFIFLYR
jgi:hypothetical protein